MKGQGVEPEESGINPFHVVCEASLGVSGTVGWTKEREGEETGNNGELRGWCLCLNYRGIVEIRKQGKKLVIPPIIVFKQSRQV